MRKLLNPRSVAIVGASDKIGPGFNAWNALQHVGFEGRVYLVNPNKPELLGQKTRVAVRDFQMRAGLLPDGLPSGEVLERMRAGS